MTEKKPDYKALLVEENKARASACWDEIQKVLEKHTCYMIGVPKFVDTPTGHTVITELRVLARDD